MRHADEKLAKPCEDDIKLEILSHELATNEGHQAATNLQNAVSLTHHEMEMVSSMSRRWSKSAAIAEQMNFASARAAMMVTYPDMASGAEFANVFKLVIDLGGDGAPFFS